MSTRGPIEALHTDLLAHPAVQAWSALRPARIEPDSIHVLRDGQKVALYRLTGVGLRGADVIAKWCSAAIAAIERTIDEVVLPHVPVTAPHYYGCLEAGHGSTCWLFLEDVGSERYSALSAEHCALAARWLGRLHAAAAHLPVAARLPDGGPGRYLEHLHTG